jgi:hypothetical protein
MKYNFKKEQCVYYIDWQNNNKKIPAIITNTRRSWTSVILNVGISKWELTDRHMQDLEATDDFTVNRHSLYPKIDVDITWNK